MSGFAALPLEAGFQETLEQLKFTVPTPVQAQALGPALEGRDLIVKAATGSGKTAVFALSLLSRLNRKFFGVQALVLCPTRELADQVAVEIRRLGRSVDHLKVVTLCGGVPLRGQAASLAHGAHVIVGTPGRVGDHLGRGTLKLDGLRTLVLDEADRMLDMGFIDDMVAVARLCPRDRQTLLFSATYPDEIAKTARPFLRDPLTVEAHSAQTTIVQRFYQAAEFEKLEVLKTLLAHHRPETTVVFVNTKARGRDVVSYLQAQGVAVLELSGDLEQRDRDEVMALFAGRCLSVLVATDVASRGLDIPVLDAVVNYELSPDPEVHVHRVGRTGRAGEGGLAFSLVSERETTLARRIQEFSGWQELPWAELAAGGSLPVPPRAMIKLLEGKKDKLRPGDVLGALTAAAGFTREQVGTIKVTEWGTWVAVDRAAAGAMLKAFSQTPVKGRVRRAFAVGWTPEDKS